MKKVGGYILVVVGLVVLAFSVETLKKYLTFLSFLNKISNSYLMIVGLVLIVLGIALLMGGGHGKQMEEVPIYRGKNIVGYRRQR